MAKRYKPDPKGTRGGGLGRAADLQYDNAARDLEKAEKRYSEAVSKGNTLLRGTRKYMRTGSNRMGTSHNSYGEQRGRRNFRDHTNKVDYSTGPSGKRTSRNYMPDKPAKKPTTKSSFSRIKGLFR